MPHFVLALISCTILLMTVKKGRIKRFAAGGLVGVITALVFDSIGGLLGLYRYQKALAPLFLSIPLFHIIYNLQTQCFF